MVIQNDTVGPLSVCVPLRYRTYVFDSETGLVKNYDKPGDFAGTFVDASASAKFKNADVGVDIATDPANLYSSSGKWNKCYSVMMTSGLSTPAPGKHGRVAYGVDYYWQVNVF